MRNIIPHFFMRLYSGIFLALCASIFLTAIFMESLIEDDAISDFVNDVLSIKHQLEKARIQQELSVELFYKQLNKDLLPFDIHWYEDFSALEPCEYCEYVKKFKGVDIYEQASGGLLSVHRFDDIQDKVIISDRPEIPEMITRQNSDIEDTLPLVFFILVLIVIAIALYWPIRKLQLQINYLNDINQKFGKGDLQLRIDKTLDEPLKEFARSFNNMAMSLSEMLNENQIFAQSVPHELRTPLSRIQLATGILRKQSKSPDDQALFDNIDQYIQDIDELCSQVITFSKLNSAVSPENTETLFLKDFISKRILQLKHSPDISLDLDIKNDIKMSCDPAYLRLIMDNLIKNALSHAEHQILVKFEILDDRYQIAVHDDGIGLEEINYEKIFIPYSRLDVSRSRKTGGTGLGLAIAKSAAKRLNANIWVSKSKLGGAVFNVLFNK